MRASAVLGCSLVLVAAGSVGPAEAVGSHGRADGGLMTGRPTAPYILEKHTIRRHSLGTDRYDAWVCAVPRNTTDDAWSDLPGRIPTDAHEVRNRLERTASPYFDWVSEGHYRLRIRARSTITLAPDESWKDCRTRAIRRSAGRDGAVLVSNVRGDLHGVAGGDDCQGNLTKPHPCRGKPSVLPSTGRTVELGSHVIFPAHGRRAHRSTVDHEFGHALTWPHSFTGRLFVPIPGGGRAGIPYDDWMDVMGFEFRFGSAPLTPEGLATGDFTPKGTQVFNRYSAGWLGRDQVVAHSGRQGRSYSLVALGSPGTQMITIPGPDRREYLTIEARLRRGFDRSLPHAGVNLHVIDQRARACDWNKPGTLGCFGENRRTTPAPTKPASLRSLLRVGESRRFGDVRISVRHRIADGFQVRVSRGRATLPEVIPEVCLLLPPACQGASSTPQ